MTAPKKPNYMFPELQGLPEEFRRLAATNSKLSKENAQNKYGYVHESVAATWEQAAQMLEEKLNG